MKHYVISLLFFLGNTLFGQYKVQDNYLSIPNLPDYEFYDVLEDKNNTIWLAADKGLFKYDGYNFLKVTSLKKKGNSVFGLKKDTKGKLWCTTIYGEFFYVKNNKLNLFIDLSEYTKNQLATFYVFQDELVVFSTSGVIKVNLETKVIEQLTKNKIISSTKANLEQVYFYELSTPLKVLKYFKGNISIVGSLQHQHNVYEQRLYAYNKDEILYIYKDNGRNFLRLLNVETNTQTDVKLPNAIKTKALYNIKQINKQLWFLTDEGVLICEIVKGEIQVKSSLLKEELTSNVVVDYNKNYWITTLDNGVFILPNLSLKKVIPFNRKAKLTSIAELSNNRFVVGNNRGMLRFFEGKTVYKEFQLPIKSKIRCLAYNKFNNTLIISIGGNKSYEYDISNNALKDLKNKYAVAKNIIFIDDSTSFYSNHKEAKIYKNGEEVSVVNSRVLSAFISNDKLYVSLPDSTISFKDSIAKEIFNFKQDAILIKKIIDENDVLFLLDHKGSLFKKEGDNVEQVEAFKNSFVNNIYTDNHNSYWVLSEGNVIQKYNIESKAIEKLTEQDGFNFDIQNVVVLDSLIVAKSPHFLAIFPKNKNSLFKEYKQPLLSIKNVVANGIDTLKTKANQLNYKQNNLRINFNSAGFESSRFIAYEYKLEPIDKVWKKVTRPNNFVEFKELLPNTYNFFVRAKNVSGKTYSKTSSISFVIRPPFWETWWFYSLIIFIVSLFVFLGMRNKLKQKERKRQEEINSILLEKKMANLKLENFRSQMNPHFIFNALNSIQDYIISNEKELASSYLVKFSRLIRVYLDYSQQNEISLANELDALKLYLQLEKGRFEDELEYFITVAPSLIIEQINVPSLFIQPYVENALKHGLLHKKNNRKLLVDLKEQGGDLVVIIEDNGIGREKAKALSNKYKKHESFATKANDERITIYQTKLKKDIRVTIDDLMDGTISKGTRVTINIPLKF